MLVIKAGIHKILVRIANGKILIRLLLKKQSDLDLHCLSRAFWQATSIQNFRTVTICTFLLNFYPVNQQDSSMGLNIY